jgi:hypothetical protein
MMAASLMPEAMQRVLTLSVEGDWASALVETFRCLGVDLTDPSVTSLRPWEYAIPEAQWSAICAALFDSHGDGIARVNRGLDWMNKGPTTWESCHARLTA